MDLSNFHPSEIVQVPAIIKAGMVELLNPDMLKLDETTLKAVASAMSGELIHLKMRATYTALENNLCIAKDCYRPATKDSDWCDDGPNHKHH
jgi:hypothetical protein